MTIAQLIEIVRNWQSTMPADEVRKATEGLVRNAVLSLDGLMVPVAFDIDALIAAAATNKSTEQDISALVQPIVVPLPPHQRGQPRQRPPQRSAKATAVDKPPNSGGKSAAKVGCSVLSPADQERLHQSSKAMQILRRQLRRGPKRGELIKAAAVRAGIGESALLEASDVLEVKCRDGAWFLPD